MYLRWTLGKLYPPSFSLITINNFILLDIKLFLEKGPHFFEDDVPESQMRITPKTDGKFLLL